MENGAASSNPQATFDNFLKQEQKFIEDNTKDKIEVKTEAKVNANGQAYWYWHFVSPSSKSTEQKPRTVQSEHYFTFICNEQILNLYSIVTNSDEPSDIQKMLTKVADTFSCESGPIDLNALKK